MLALGLVAAVVDAFVLRGNFQDLAYDAIGGVSVVTMALGVRRFPPNLRRGWLTLTAGLALWVAGDLVWSWYTVFLNRDAPYPGIADLLYLLGYPLAAVGLIWMTRGGGRDRPRSFVDATIVSLGVAVVVWQLILDPSVDSAQLAFSQKAVVVAYPGMDMVLLLLLVLRVVFAGRLRTVSAVLVAGGLGLTFAADVSSAALTFVGLTENGLNLPWLMGYVLAAAAVRHPQAGVSAEGIRRTRIAVSDRSRFALLGVTGCTAPALLITMTVLHHHVDAILISSCAIVIFGLVLSQLYASLGQLRASADAQLSLSSELMHRANHDALTGAANREAFMHYAEAALTGSQRKDTTLVAGFIDLDGFKAINDGAGHFVGDELIVAVAARLRRCVRAGDVLGRFGGDEFAILMEVPTTTDLREIGDRIVTCFEDAFPTSAGSLHIRASVGLAVAESTSTTEELLAAADAAMYTAKQEGKNRYAFYEAGTQERMLDRLAVQETVQEAISQQRIEVHYQPIVDIETRNWVSLEALVRCRTRNGELLSPAAFLPVAEESGLMATIDRIVLTTALADLAAWRRLPAGQGLSVSVNASARALHASDFADVVTSLTNNAGLPPESLTIELTEDVHIAAAHRSGQTLQQLRELGFHIALDDFGTGYSSLAYLNQLPVDIIKVPIQFTTMLSQDERSRSLVRTILSLVKTVGATAVAEGVETAEQWTQLMALGCERGQGFHFARPIPAIDITHRLQQNEAAVRDSA